jgi:cytochrome c-type biogenesis protein CcmH
MTTFVVVAIFLTLAVLALLLVPLLLKERKQRLGSSSQLSVAVLRDQLNDLEDQRKAGTLDPKVFAEEQAELERRALEDGVAPDAAKPSATGRKLALAAVLGVGLPALAVGLYFMLGSPETMKSQQAAGAAGAGEAGSPHSLGPQQIEAMAAKLAERLQANPDDGEGWLMLGRSYSTLGHRALAARREPACRLRRCNGDGAGTQACRRTGKDHRPRPGRRSASHQGVGTFRLGCFRAR